MIIEEKLTSQWLCGLNVMKASAFRRWPSSMGLEYVSKLSVLRGGG